MVNLTITSAELIVDTEPVEINVTLTGFGSQSIINDGLFKRASDNIIYSESLAISTSKGNITDFTNISEVVSISKEMFRFYDEQFSNIEYVALDVLPSISDSSNFYETENFIVDKLVSENYNLFETIQYSMDIVLIDISSIYESFGITTDKVLSDTGSISEVVTSVTDYYRNFSDIVTLFEITDLPMPETVTDDSSYTDTYTLSIGKVLNDISILNEILSIDISALINTDIANISEVISTNPNIAKIDITNNYESTYYNIDKVSSDVISMSEVLIGYKQDYFLSDYVEPGYVGTIINM